MRDLHAVTAIRRAAFHVVQEDNLTVPFLDADRGVVDAIELAGEGGPFMIVRGEQRAGFVDPGPLYTTGPDEG